MVLAVVWAYLEKVDATKRLFRVKIKRGQTHIETGYKVTVMAAGEKETYIEVKLDTGEKILPISNRHECVAVLTRASASQENVVYIVHPYHYLSVPERITYYFTREKYSFDGWYDSSHPRYDRNFKSWDAYLSRPVGMKTEGYLKSTNLRTELEITEFHVDG